MSLSIDHPEHCVERSVQFFALPTSPQITQDPALWGTTLDVSADVLEEHRAGAVIKGVYVNGTPRNFTRWPDRLAVWVAPRIPYEAARVRVVYSIPTKAPHGPPESFPEHIRAHPSPTIHYGLQARI